MDNLLCLIAAVIGLRVVQVHSKLAQLSPCSTNQTKSCDVVQLTIHLMGTGMVAKMLDL
jgi:hypothetical protein